MNVREIIPLTYSGGKLTVATDRLVEFGKLACLQRHKALHESCNFFSSSGNEIKSITACNSRSQSPSDGAPFSSQSSFKDTLQSSFLHSLSRYDIGPSGLVEGTLGLLLLAGTLALGARILWQKASQIASLPHTYEAVMEFPFASGITIGTPVRMRGVDVGTVINVRPCLERIDAKVQVMDSAVCIPRNALVEVNQSGLLGETQIDITPKNPVPQPSVGPLHPDCSTEGLIVCDKGRIEGQQGVSMDDLMRLCGKMARNTKQSDVNDMFKTIDQLRVSVDSTKPLLEKVETFVEDVGPVMKGLQDGRLVKDLSELLKLATRTTESLRTSSFTAENRRLLLDSVGNLATTLKELERTSESMGDILRNDKTRRNMKQFVELLSRLLDA